MEPTKEFDLIGLSCAIQQWRDKLNNQLQENNVLKTIIAQLSTYIGYKKIRIYDDRKGWYWLVYENKTVYALEPESKGWKMWFEETGYILDLYNYGKYKNGCTELLLSDEGCKAMLERYPLVIEGKISKVEKYD